MIAAIRAEFRKQFSTRVWWVLALVTFGWTGANVALLAVAYHYGADASASQGVVLATGDEMARQLYSLGTTFGYVFPVAVGAIAVTGEFQHKTIAATLLAQPRRWRVVLGKWVAMAPLGAAYGVVVVAGCLACGSGLLAALGEPAALADQSTWEMFGRMVGAMTIWGLVGVGLGLLARSQALAVVSVLAFTMFLEPLVRVLPFLLGHEVAGLEYLPGAVGDAITGASIYSALSPSGVESGLLQPGWAAVVLLGYAGVLTVLGYFVRLRNDVV